MLERGDILDLLFADDECLTLTHDRCLRLTAVPTEVLAPKGSLAPPLRAPLRRYSMISRRTVSSAGRT